MNGGRRRVGDLSRWTFAPRLGKMGGGRSGCKEREKRSQRVKGGGEIGDRSGGEGERDDPEHGCNRWGRRDRSSVIISARD